MSLMDFVNVIGKYAGASAANPPETAEQDFSHVAQTVPQNQLAGGLAHAFRSNDTPAFPQMIGQLFSHSDGQQRAGILNQLLSSGGPNVASLLGGLLGGGKTVTPEQAQQVSPEVVQQAAQHAQSNNPSIVDEASNFYAQHPKVVQALGAGALALIMSHVSQNR